MAFYDDYSFELYNIQIWHPAGDTMMECLPREDGFPEGEARGKTILPREIFHHGIPSGMLYLFYYTEQTSIW